MLCGVHEDRLLIRVPREDTEAQLDKLGGAGWQSRRAKMKKRILEMAHGLIKIAAERHLRAQLRHRQHHADGLESFRMAMRVPFGTYRFIQKPITDMPRLIEGNTDILLLNVMHEVDNEAA